MAFLNNGRAERGLSEAAFQDAAQRLGCDVAAIKAVAEVESAGSGFLPDGRPTILFERHLFYRLTKGRFPASDINSSTPGGYEGNVKEYERLNRAAALDALAAIKSASWGRFQILGLNHKACGFETATEFVEAIKDAEEAHLKAFVSFVETNNLAKHLRTRNWPEFARGYNGPSYRKNAYDVKLARAVAKYDKEMSASVSKVQSRLNELGFKAGNVDGIFGNRTRSALTTFQEESKLPVTGILTTETMVRLLGE